MDVSNRRIVLLGKTGSGKSSLANTIFGEKLFTISHSLNSETRKCQSKTKSDNGRSITLIDTPGFFDTDRSEEELKPEILRCITECSPGPHAFLIVLKVERFTEQEQAVINKIHQYFSEEVFKYTTVVFTHGEQLPEGQTIEDFVCLNKLMSDLVKKCGNRCHVIDNKYWNEDPKDKYRSNQFQVEELLKSIDKMVMKNKGSCYTNEMLQAVEEEIQQEEEHIRLLSGNMSKEEVREQAKGRVHTKLSVRLAGIGTGALLGALFGVVVLGGLVVLVLKKIVPLKDLAKAAAGGAPAAAGGAAAAAGGAAAGGTATAAGGAAAAGAAAAAGGAAAGATGAAAAGGAAAGGAAAGGTAAGGAAAGGTAAAAAGGAAAGGAAAGGTAAAAAGGAAAGGETAAAAGATGGAVGVSVGAVIGTSAAVGALIGGVTGYYTAEGADTPLDAAKRTAVAVKNRALSVLDQANDVLERFSQSKSKQS